MSKSKKKQAKRTKAAKKKQTRGTKLGDVRGAYHRWEPNASGTGAKCSHCGASWKNTKDGYCYYSPKGKALDERPECVEKSRAAA